MHRLLWHNDGAYGAKPGIATSLWAVEISPDASPTRFANVVDIVDELPDDLRHKVEQLHVQNVRDTAFDRTYERVPPGEIASTEDPDRYVTFEHPILYDPPHLARKAIIASEQMTSHITDLPLDEGEALLQDLFRIMYDDDNVYTHRWERNDVIMWDNIALHHSRPAEVPTDMARHSRRQCIDGWNTDDGLVMDWTFARVTVRNSM